MWSKLHTYNTYLLAHLQGQNYNMLDSTIIPHLTRQIHLLHSTPFWSQWMDTLRSKKGTINCQSLKEPLMCTCLERSCQEASSTSLIYSSIWITWTTWDNSTNLDETTWRQWDKGTRIYAQSVEWWLSQYIHYLLEEGIYKEAVVLTRKVLPSSGINTPIHIEDRRNIYT